jgi:hypothetical protein
MTSNWTFTVRVGTSNEGISDPPFFEVGADTVTFEPDGTIAITSRKGHRRIAPGSWDWKVCEIRRNRSLTLPNVYHSGGRRRSGK